MAITQITVDDVLERFPQFEGREAEIELLIPEVYLWVDDRFPTNIQKYAALYLTAHWLTVETTAADEASSGGASIASESMGPFSITYAKSQTTTGDMNGFRDTVYGRRFLTYCAGLFGGPVVV
jgi:hypothetical protein